MQNEKLKVEVPSEKEMQKIERNMRKVATRREVAMISDAIAQERIQPLAQHVGEMGKILQVLIQEVAALTEVFIDKQIVKDQQELNKYLEAVREKIIKQLEGEADGEEKQEQGK